MIHLKELRRVWWRSKKRFVLAMDKFVDIILLKQVDVGLVLFVCGPIPESQEFLLKDMLK